MGWKKSLWPLLACAAGTLATPALANCTTSAQTKDLIVDLTAATAINNKLAQNQNVVLKTTATGVCGPGQRSIGPGDIRINAMITWSTSAKLTIRAYHSIGVASSMAVTGPGRLVLRYNGAATDGALRFLGANANANGADVAFTDVVAGVTQGALKIGGHNYRLADNLSQLAGYIASNPQGYFALAHDYDAGADGIYHTSPIMTSLGGTFEGLGNTIGGLTVHCTADDDAYFGLFRWLNPGATVRDIGLVGPNYACADDVQGGALVAVSDGGTVLQSFVRGNFQVSVGERSYAGGLVGAAGGANARGTIALSFAAGGTVTAGSQSTIGGLVADDYNSLVSESYATASTSCGGSCWNGGLVGYTNGGGTVQYSYAVAGSVHVPVGSSGGGLFGYMEDPFVQTYTANAVTGHGTIGGFMGEAHAVFGTNASYWDTVASGRSQGVGNIPNDPDVTGLTTTQLQSGLPAGFDPAVWAQSAGINGGYPYLMNLPPQ